MAKNKSKKVFATLALITVAIGISIPAQQKNVEAQAQKILSDRPTQSTVANIEVSFETEETQIISDIIEETVNTLNSAGESTEEETGNQEEQEESGSQQEEQEEQEESGSNNPFGSLKDETEAGRESEDSNQIEPDPEQETTGGLVNDAETKEDSVADKYETLNPSNTENNIDSNIVITDDFRDTSRTGVNPWIWIGAGLAGFVVLAGGTAITIAAKTKSKRFAKVETKLNADSANYSSIVDFQKEVEKLFATNSEKSISKLKKLFAKCKAGTLDKEQEIELKKSYAKKATINKTTAKNNVIGSGYSKDDYKYHLEAIKDIAKADELTEAMSTLGKNSKKINKNTEKINALHSSADTKMTEHVTLGSVNKKVIFPEGPTFEIHPSDEETQVHPVSIKRAIAYSSSVDGSDLKDTLDRVQQLFPVANKVTKLCGITLTTENKEKIELQCAFTEGLGYEICKAALLSKVKEIIGQEEKVVSVVINESQQNNKVIEKLPKTTFAVDINTQNNVSALIKEIDTAEKMLKKFNETYDTVNNYVFNDQEIAKNETAVASEEQPVMSDINNFDF